MSKARTPSQHLESTQQDSKTDSVRYIVPVDDRSTENEETGRNIDSV